MDFLTHLIHNDMFLAVVSYLSLGLAFLLYFYFREKKWEADLARYEVKPVFVREAAVPSYRPGTLSINSNSNKIVAVVGLNEEMQVVDGQPPEAAPSPGGATILPFRPVHRTAPLAQQQRPS